VGYWLFERSNGGNEMSKKYTDHLLSDRQCRVLSQIYNGRLRNHFQPTLDVLMRKKLIGEHYTYGGYYITDMGKITLSQARREGW
jgi:hypothetical protein